MNTISEKDSSIQFPHFVVLKASAGSGKTRTLARRFVQFLLSGKIQKNALENMIAITFTNNAAKEMKTRIIKMLKDICLCEAVQDNGKKEIISELISILSLDRAKLIEKAEGLIDKILMDYSDFNVHTIDSFMSRVFRVSSLDFGYNPDFDILMKNDAVAEYSFELFLKNVREGTDDAALLDKMIPIITEHKDSDASYLWDPSKTILKEIKGIYRKLSLNPGKLKVADYSIEIESVKGDIRKELEELDNLIKEHRIKKHGNSVFDSFREEILKNDFSMITGREFKNPPVVKDRQKQKEYEQIIQKWEKLKDIVKKYKWFYSHSYYYPYLKVYEKFIKTLEEVKKGHSLVFIEDINRKLAEYMNQDIVPDIYFRIGETIFHYFIDEFQDTSLLQWNNLTPLIENSLSQGGSLFVVGDTKQAIYSFRGADYRIMKRCESTNPFSSAYHDVEEIKTNHRSYQKILDFNSRYFRENVAKSDEFKDAGEKSGLTNYNQSVKPGNEGRGHAEVHILDKNDSGGGKSTTHELIKDLKGRGYEYRDIAILTRENDNAVEVSTWLNEEKIPIISYSSLDVRKNKIVCEIISLLKFLDSPRDDLSFATFIMGNIFSTVRKTTINNIEDIRNFIFRNRKRSGPLYKAYKEEFKDMWDKYFDGLFKSTGYLPLYDLVTEIFRVFKMFTILDNQEAALIKTLEVIKDFESSGNNSLKEFLIYFDEDADESVWNIDIPRGEDAVRIMTIHKSKGLEFPVVIALLYGERKRWSQDYFLKEEAGEISLLKINKNIASSHDSLKDLYNKEYINYKVNMLNSLYVAFTRAQAEMYIIGIKEDYKNNEYTDLLPVSEFSPSIRPSEILKKSTETDKGALLSLKNDGLPAEFAFCESRKTYRIGDKKRGEFIHRILYFIDYTDGEFDTFLKGIVSKVNAEIGMDYPEGDAIKTIKGLLENSIVRGYFLPQPDRVIKKEQELSDRRGNLFRIDRLVIDNDVVTVIDFKTGRDKELEVDYDKQIGNYITMLKDIYPERRVEGVIVYVDLREVRRVV